MKHNIYVRISADLLIKMLTVAAWYTGMFGLTITIMVLIIRSNIWEASVVESIGMPLMTGVATISGYSTRIYMLVMGIVYPLVCFPHYIAAGTTRLQYAVGQFIAAAVLSICLSLARWPLVSAAGMSPLTGMADGVYGMLAFTTGWLGVAGFQYARLIPIILSVVSAVTLRIVCVMSESLTSMPLGRAALYTVITAAGMAAVLYAVRRVPIKC